MNIAKNEAKLNNFRRKAAKPEHAKTGKQSYGISETFGTKLREERKRRGLKTAELAKLLDLSPSYLALMERGARTPSVKVLLRVCDMFDKTPNEMMNVGATRKAADEASGSEKYQAASALLRMFNDTELDVVVALLRSTRMLCVRN